MLVDAEERHVERVAREREVVRIAAVERGVELRREHQSDVGELLVEIQVVLRALIERHHLALQAGLLFRFVFDRGHRRPPRRQRARPRHRRLDRGVHARGDVLDAVCSTTSSRFGRLHFLRQRSRARKPFFT